MNIPEGSGTFQKLPEGSGTFRNILRGNEFNCFTDYFIAFRNVMFPQRMFRKLPEGSGTFRKVPEPSGRFWNVHCIPSLTYYFIPIECSGTFRKVLECSLHSMFISVFNVLFYPQRMFRNLPEGSGMFIAFHVHFRL